MTKLLRWINWLLVYFVIWISLLKGFLPIPNDEWKVFVTLLPSISVVIFGIYSVGIVLWRVYSISDCPEAEKELLKQAEEAKEYLKKKGLNI